MVVPGVLKNPAIVQPNPPLVGDWEQVFLDEPIGAGEALAPQPQGVDPTELYQAFLAEQTKTSLHARGTYQLNSQDWERLNGDVMQQLIVQDRPLYDRMVQHLDAAHALPPELKDEFAVMNNHRDALVKLAEQRQKLLLQPLPKAQNRMQAQQKQLEDLEQAIVEAQEQLQETSQTFQMHLAAHPAYLQKNEQLMFNYAALALYIRLQQVEAGRFQTLARATADHLREQMLSENTNDLLANLQWVGQVAGLIDLATKSQSILFQLQTTGLDPDGSIAKNYENLFSDLEKFQPTHLNQDAIIHLQDLQFKLSLPRLWSDYDQLNTFRALLPWLGDLIGTTQADLLRWMNGTIPKRIEVMAYLAKRQLQAVYPDDAAMMQAYLNAKYIEWQQGLDNFETLKTQASNLEAFHHLLKTNWNQAYADKMDRVNDMSQSLPEFQCFLQGAKEFREEVEKVFGPINPMNPHYMEVQRLYEVTRMTFGDVKSGVSLQHLAMIFPIDSKTAMQMQRVMQNIVQKQNAGKTKQADSFLRLHNPAPLKFLYVLEQVMQGKISDEEFSEYMQSMPIPFRVGAQYLSEESTDVLAISQTLRYILQTEECKIFWERNLETMQEVFLGLENLADQIASEQIDEITSQEKLRGLFQKLHRVMAASYGEDILATLQSHKLKTELRLKDETDLAFTQRRISLASLEGRRRQLYDSALMLQGKATSPFPDQKGQDPVMQLPADQIMRSILGVHNDDPALIKVIRKNPQLHGIKDTCVANGVYVYDHVRQGYNLYLQAELSQEGIVQHNPMEETLARLEFATQSLQYVDRFENLLDNHRNLNDLENQLAELGEMDGDYLVDGQAFVPRVYKMRKKWAEAYREVAAGHFEAAQSKMQGILQRKYSLAKETERLADIHAKREFVLDVGIVLLSSYMAPFAAGLLLRGASLVGRLRAVAGAARLVRSSGAMVGRGLAHIPGATRLGHRALGAGRWLLTTPHIRSPAFGFTHALSFHLLEKNFQFIASELGVGRHFVWDRGLSAEQNAAHFAWDVMAFNPMLRVLARSEALALRCLPNRLKALRGISVREQIQHMQLSHAIDPQGGFLIRGAFGIAGDVAKRPLMAATRFAGEYMGFNVWGVTNDIVLKSALRFADGEFKGIEDAYAYWDNAFSKHHMMEMAKGNLSFLLGLKTGGFGARRTIEKIQQRRFERERPNIERIEREIAMTWDVLERRRHDYAQNLTYLVIGDSKPVHAHPDKFEESQRLQGRIRQLLKQREAAYRRAGV
ncbi:MAG: hypothetical protein HYU97_10485 [Deltaproteobacteria bacterium]|nr:hypothetical protein [Deltaproteobacteria bacterium]